MRTSLFLLFAILSTINASGQTAEEKPVLDVINKLWEGMQKGDSASVHKCFSDDVTLVSVFRTKANGPVRKREALKEFLDAVGKPHEQTWYEETWNYKVEINGDLASVWCDYAFYLDNSFSHCGVDAFHLHHTDLGWKIIHLADTRQRTGCSIPEHIQAKHKQ